MKAGLTILFALGAFVAAPIGAFAQAQIDLYADMAMSQCELTDESPALQSIHMFFVGTDAASAVNFAAPRPACWQGATWLTDMVPVPRATLGNTQTDWTTTLNAEGFPDCRTPPVYLGAMLFSTTGGALPCCEIGAVFPPVTIGGPPFTYVDCGFVSHSLVPGRKLVINANDSCRCQASLAVEASTWGRVKSLYR